MKLDPFIEAEKTAGHSVQKTCGLFEVSKSAYYERRNGAPSASETSPTPSCSSRSGPSTPSPRAPMAPRGSTRSSCIATCACGKRKVTRLMRQAGLEGRCKKRWRKTTVADPSAEAARDLIQRHFGPCEEMDRRYVGDITYIATWEGWAYLATVIDLASRRIVGWALADHMRTELVEDALDHGLRQPRPEQGVIFHSDRGCQYTSQDFAELARANGVVLSVGRKGECWDNAVAESFFATIKRELIDTRAWPTRTGLDALSSSTSRAGTTRVACTRRSATSARPNTKLSTTTPTVRRHDQHKQPVRQTGSSPPRSNSYTTYKPQNTLTLPYYRTGIGSCECRKRSGADRHPRRSPRGRGRVHRGDCVHATDGEIGIVKGLVIERQSHRVTHVLLQEGICGVGGRSRARLVPFRHSRWNSAGYAQVSRPALSPG